MGPDGIRDLVQAAGERARLQAELSQLKRLIFGSKRERYVPEAPPEQLCLFGDLEQAIGRGEQEQPKQTVTYQRRSRKGKPLRQPIPADFPREEILVEPDFDTTGLTVIGRDVTEVLEYVPAFFKVLCYVRLRYAERGNPDAGVKIAPMPSLPIPKGIAGPGLLARIVTDKFCDHLPFYRQQQRYKREGYEIPSSTLEGWFARTAELLAPLGECFRKKTLEADYLQVDETGLRVLDRDKPSGKLQGYLWSYHAPGQKLVFFDYRPGRSRAGPAAILRNFKGWLQTDGYSAYEEFEKRSGISLVGCLAHARRYFERALEAYPAEAAEVLGWIQELYAVEREARQQELGPEQRYELRQRKALPVIDRIGQWAVEQHRNPVFTPKDTLGKAFGYLVSRFSYIARYLRDGRLEIDNNLVENLIMPVALGRKNYLFAGSHKGAERAALMYTLIGCCKLHRIDPFAYLRDVIARLPDHGIQRLEELMPGRWEPLKIASGENGLQAPVKIG